MSYDPFEVLQEKVAAPRLRREDRAPEREAPSVSLAEAAEQSGLPEAVLAAAVRKGTLPSRTIAEQGVLRPGVQLDEVEFARESLSTSEVLPGGAEDAVDAECAEAAPSTSESAPEREERAEAASLEDDVDAEDPGPENPGPENPGPENTGPEDPGFGEPADRDDGASTALVEVELAVQGWREAKEALEVAREEHRAELVRLERVLLASEAREASTRRWGRVGAVAAGLVLLAAGAFVVQLQSGHGEALASERARAGLLEGQLEVTGQQLRERTREVAAQRAAAAAAAERAEVEASRASALGARVEALEAERAAAAAAWASALSSLGWR